VSGSAVKVGPRHIPALDGLRGIAALAVFFHHAVFTAIDPAQWPAVWQPIIALSHFGQYGLDLFFVLSGYLITTILTQTRDRPDYFRRFYFNRLTRILPIYLIVLVAVIALVPGSTGYVVLSALFIANFAQAFHVTVVGPFWTLAIEEQFYLGWPWLAHRLSRERLARIAVAILIGGPTLRLIDIAIGHHNFQFTFFHLDGLAFGALLACRADRLRRNPITSFAAGAAVCTLSLYVFESPFLDMPLEALQLTGISLMAYAVIVLAIDKEDTAPVRWLGQRGLVCLGQISYGFYLIHLYVFWAFDALFGPVAGVDPKHLAVRVITALVVTIVLSVLSQQFIEMPAMSLRKRLV
jgi:peptidoglycan/LPS O-acetylase OafA/YrhL